MTLTKMKQIKGQCCKSRAPKATTFNERVVIWWRSCNNEQRQFSDKKV